MNWEKWLKMCLGLLSHYTLASSQHHYPFIQSPLDSIKT